MSEDPRIDVLKRDIGNHPTIDASTKLLLTQQLHYAQEINGTADPVMQGIQRILITQVNSELSLRTYIDEVFAKHVEVHHKDGGKIEVPKTWGDFVRQIASSYPQLTIIAAGAALLKWGPALLAFFQMTPQ